VKLTHQRTDPDLVRQLTILAAIIGSIVINTISNFFPPDGVDMATLSDRLFTSVQILPANYAFAIWAPIYLGLIALGIYQVQPAQRHNPSLQRSGYLLVFACIAQCAWIYLFLANQTNEMISPQSPATHKDNDRTTEFQRFSRGEATCADRSQSTPTSLTFYWSSVTYMWLECVNDDPDFLSIAAAWANPQIEAMLLVSKTE
jgi:hypothetical protein